MGWYENYVVPHLVNLTMRNELLVPYRRRTLSLADGRVLEIGVGSGLNLAFYPGRATEILGLDPHPKLLTMARRRKNSRFTLTTLEGSAESIALDDSTVDTVVTTWTLCTIPDVTRALGEVRRVLKRSGRLLFVEHGMAQDESVRRWQQRLTPLLKCIAGGCHLDRPIGVLIQEAGFEVAHLETGYMRGPKPMAFIYEGYARPI